MPTRSDLVLVAPVVCAALVSACSGNIVSGSDASTTSTQALLSVNRTANATDPASARAQAAAYFLRLSSGADQTLAARLVGASKVLPAVGQCEPVEVLGDQGMPLASLGPVDLVDVGQVVVEAAPARATLAARAFPDVVDLVSGVVYTTRDMASSPLPDRGTYTFKVAGSAAIPSMTLQGRAPGALQELEVSGVRLSDQPMPLSRGDVTLTWTGQSSADFVYVELSSAEDGPLERVRCTFVDEGRAVIAASDLPKAASQTITVHIVHRETVVAPGLDGGEIEFDFATSGALRFEAAPTN